jgi:hypothetical protein
LERAKAPWVLQAIACLFENPLNQLRLILDQLRLQAAFDVQKYGEANVSGTAVWIKSDTFGPTDGTAAQLEKSTGIELLQINRVHLEHSCVFLAWLSAFIPCSKPTNTSNCCTLTKC